MYFGQNWGPYGDPDRHVASLEVVPTYNGAKVRVKASPNIGDSYYQVYVNNVFSGAVWCPEGLTSDWVNVQVPTSGNASIVVFNTGTQQLADNSIFARIDEEEPQQVKASWTWGYEVLGTADNNKLTNWVLSGLSKLQTLPSDLSTRGDIPVSLSVSGGTATVNVGTLASGSGALGTTVTLTALDGSGVSGSVDVAADAVTASATLTARWPEFMRILRDTFDPPTTVQETVKYNGEGTGEKVDPDVLEVGTYYYAFQAISDTDDVGDKSASTTIVVSGAPGPPTDLSYGSGNAAATNITWTASTTAGATYNIYVQNVDDDFMATDTPTQTAIAGSTSAILPAITGYPGRAQALVRAELGGIEEQNLDFLLLDYDSSGNYIDKRPNVPIVRTVTVSSGLSLSVAGTYRTTDEKASPASLQLFIRTPTGNYDFNTPDATGTLGSAAGEVRTGTVSDTLLTPGWYFITLKSVTSGSIQSDGSAPEVAVYVSDVNVSAPTGTFSLTRG